MSVYSEALLRCGKTQERHRQGQGGSYAAVMAVNSRCRRFYRVGYVTIPLTDKTPIRAYIWLVCAVCVSGQQVRAC